VYSVYLKEFSNELHEVVKRLHILGRKGSEKLEDNTGNTLSKKILLALRQCVLAASSADACTKKFLLSLHSSEGKLEITLSSMDDSSYRLNFDLGKKNKIHYHG
jgi:hypothetical protein